MPRRVACHSWKSRCFAYMLRRIQFSDPPFTFTDGALKLLMETGTNPIELLERHRRGDWGYGQSIQETLIEMAAGAPVASVSKFRLGDPTDWKKRIVLYTDVGRQRTTFMTTREFLSQRDLYPL